MANVFIYGGLGIMLLGSIFGFFVAVKGYKNTDWDNIKRISARGKFMRGPMTPTMKKLVGIWGSVMVVGFILVGIGITIGLN